MTIQIQSKDLIFTPLMLNDVLITFKEKSIDVKNKLMFTSLYKIFEIIHGESISLKKELSNSKINFTPEDINNINFEHYYDILEAPEDNLWTLHDKFKDSTNAYEIQLFNIIDNILDNFASINNILGYFESQLIQSSKKSA